MNSMALVSYKGEKKVIEVPDDEEEETIIEYLPPEIILEICSYLAVKDLHLVLRCVPNWRSALDCNSFWKKLCKRKGYNEISEWERTPKYKELLRNADNYWQGIYFYNEYLTKNWIEGNYEETKVVTDDDGLGEFYYLDDEFIVFDKVIDNSSNINVYDVKSMKICHSVKSKNASGLIVLRCRNFLCVVFREEGVKIFNLYDGTFILDNFTDAKDIKMAFVYPKTNNLVTLVHQTFFIKFNVETGENILESLDLDNLVIDYTARNFASIASSTNQTYLRIFTCVESCHTIAKIALYGVRVCFQLNSDGNPILDFDIEKSTKHKEVFYSENSFGLQNLQFLKYPDRENLKVLNFYDNSYFDLKLERGEKIVQSELTDRFIISSIEWRTLPSNSGGIKLWCRKTGRQFSTRKYMYLRITKILAANTLLMATFKKEKSEYKIIRVFDYEKKIPSEIF